MTTSADPRYDDLSALFFNCTLKPSPQLSHTQGLMDLSAAIMRKHGVRVETIRAVDHDIATGVWPDMTEHGAATDAWPSLYPKVLDADILVIAGPIWLGDNSSVTKQVIERLYACSHLLNDSGQYASYGRVGGRLITGNEDGVKHCAQNILYSLQHLGYVIPPQADAGCDRRGRPGTVLPRPRIRWAGQRLHQPQHHLARLDPGVPAATPRVPDGAPIVLPIGSCPRSTV